MYAYKSSDTAVARFILEKFFFRGLRVTVSSDSAGFFSLALVIAVSVALIQFCTCENTVFCCTMLYLDHTRNASACAAVCRVSTVLPGAGIVIDPFSVCGFWSLQSTRGAYCAETMRGALEAVPYGQVEAGRCVGMTYLQIMRRIVLPQAFRTAFSSAFERN
jgi:cystine transport system permease protein